MNQILPSLPQLAGRERAVSNARGTRALLPPKDYRLTTLQKIVRVKIERNN